MKKWKLVFSGSKQKKASGSEAQKRLGIRDVPTRVIHAAFLDEYQTVCGIQYDVEELPDRTAGFFPNCGNCYNKLKNLSKRERK